MKICDRLVEFVDGQLTSWVEVEFRDHLVNCERCRVGVIQKSVSTSEMRRAKLHQQVQTAEEALELFERRYFRRRSSLREFFVGLLKFLWICTWPVRALVRGLAEGRDGSL